MVEGLQLNSQGKYQGKFIHGNSGTYDSKTDIGRGANAGYKVAQLLKKQDYDTLELANIQYATKDKNGQVRREEALSFNHELSKALNPDKDGKISKETFLSAKEIEKSKNAPPELKGRAKATLGNIFDAIDLNGDGKVDNAENTAYTMFQDACNDEVKGITTPSGRLQADMIISKNPAFAKDRMKKIYNYAQLDKIDKQLKDKYQ